MGMRGSGDRIEPIYFQHQIFDFFFIFFGSYMYENFGNFLLIIFTISKIDFTKNFGPGRADPDQVVVVTREAVIGSRQPLHVVTDFLFYGFF